jgi:hypothetical protein
MAVQSNELRNSVVTSVIWCDVSCLQGHVLDPLAFSKVTCMDRLESMRVWEGTRHHSVLIVKSMKALGVHHSRL